MYLTELKNSDIIIIVEKLNILYILYWGRKNYVRIKYLFRS